MATNCVHRDLVQQILTWLPVKPLMRFKAVSKLWLSIILDPSFARAYRGGFRGLLLTTPDPNPWVHQVPPRDVLYLKLDGTSGQLSRQLSLDTTMSITEAVNGLVCLYQGNDSSVCNIATHEIVKLPVSRYLCEFATYHLGFDPVNSLYKLLKICPVYEEEGGDYLFVHNMECEILTLGVDSSWRSIDPAPESMETQSICINGVMHWTDPYRFEPLIAFHLADEKFRETPPCPSQLCLPDFGTTNLFLLAYFSQIGDVESFTTSHYRLGRWTKPQNFKFPHEFKDVDELDAVGMLPDGKLLFADLHTNPSMPVYVFDETNGTFEKIDVTKSCNYSSLVKISYHEETIISLCSLLDSVN